MINNINIITFLIVISLVHLSSEFWWSVDQNEPLLQHTRICSRFRKLRGSLKMLCRKDSQIMEEAHRGFSAAMRQCEFQFKYQRWNCSMNRKSLKTTLNQDTKEAAILNAFAAAGVAYTIAESCSKGKLTHCSCGSLNEVGPDDEVHYYESYNEEQNKPSYKTNQSSESHNDQVATWRWGGCSEAVNFGNKISRKLSDGLRYHKALRSDVRSVVRHHNSEVGRKIMKRMMQKICKCHGLSGSCNFKTCFLKLPSMKQIGDVLFRKYFNAVKVTSTNDGLEIVPTEGWKELSKEDLVFLEPSPNFCRRNFRSGSLGTKGRECSTNGSLSGNCELLCCGKGYTTRIEQEEENCNCIFTFCCKVTCEKCKISKTKSYCN